MFDLIGDWALLLWPFCLALLHAFLVTVSTIHIVMNKRETRAAIGWAGLVWFTPILGSALYFGFGVNRIQRKAMRMRLQQAWTPTTKIAPVEPRDVTPDAIERVFPSLSGLSRLVGNLTQLPLVSGNQIEPLRDGDQAFPAMLKAIHSAEHSITLASYIFDVDPVGMMFCEALQAATRRQVAVRVLIDDVGSRYSKPRMIKILRQAEIPVATFLPTRVPRLAQYANLRNHRKILVVDGKLAFTGGTNLREAHWLARNPTYPVQCLHFKLQGPVVRQLQTALAIDWAFASGESLSGPLWFPELQQHQDIWARGIADGPDEDFEILHDTLLGAIASAERSIKIATPYFLPETPLIDALNVAALRGLDVRIHVPQKNNIPLVDWASRAIFPQLIEKGCRIFLTPPPFDHTKLMIVDEQWTLIGSTNWDPRSLRLNFEFNVECYSRPFARQLDAMLNDKFAQSQELTLSQLESRPWRLQLRDSLARLATPYL